MKILLSWLNEFFSEHYTCQQVVDALFHIGIEVEHVEEMGKGLDNVVVARIDDAQPHPNADKLTKCRVFNGTDTLDIVCGAKNFKVGDHVALAQVGAVLPGDFKIQKSKIRGEESFGMLCSNDELGLPNATEGILILEKTTVPGKSIKEALGLNDAVLHLFLTPNRGDCFSVLGIAIEVAAALNVKIKPPVKSLSTFQNIPMQVEILSTDGCPKYALLKIDQVSVGPSSTLVQQRLERCGTRAVNNIVDFTNYMMLERGQPMHAFDADRVSGKIQIRKAHASESMECLDGVTRKLSKDDLIIADEAGPLAIAGVMGGLRASITDSTKNIFLESAVFDPKTVRTTSRRLNLTTESSKRFEREIDPSSVLSIAMKTASMIEEFANGKILGGVDFDHLKLTPHKIHLTHNNIQVILGVEIPNAGEYLSRLGFSLEKQANGWSVEVPYRRPEIKREIDLIEEIARIHGYGNIPSRLPVLQIEPKMDSTFVDVDHLRKKAVALGLQEARTYSFISRAWATVFIEPFSPTLIEVQNPMTPATAVMRNSLLPGLLESWKNNHAHQSHGVHLFEVGKTFGQDGSNIRETLKLSAVWAGMAEYKTWYSNERQVSFYHGKGFLEDLFRMYQVSSYSFVSENLPEFLHPGQSARVWIAKKSVGFLGLLHPSVCRSMDLQQPICVAEIELEILLELSHRKPKFQSYSSFPKVERDLAVIMKKNVKHENVISEITRLKIPFLSQVYVFDKFEGKGIPTDSQSLAYRFVFQSPEKTLTDPEIEQAMGQVLNHLKAKFEALVRS